MAPGGRGADPDMLLAECKTGCLCSRQLSRSSCLYGLVCCTRCSTRAICFFPALGTSGHSSKDKFVWTKKKFRSYVCVCVCSLSLCFFIPCISVLQYFYSSVPFKSRTPKYAHVGALFVIAIGKQQSPIAKSRG